jgi:hypothetical protein
MWNMKRTIVHTITAATEIVTKGIKKNLEVITGKYSVDSLQKTAPFSIYPFPAFVHDKQ